MNYSTQIRKANSRDYKSIMEVWESAVLSTHYFLQQDDFNRYKQNLPIYFEFVELYVIENLESKVVGFIGVVETVLELLFIDATYHSRGYGQSLLHFAVDKLKIKTVEVNEQNHKAVKFYLQAGFSIVNRRPIDNDDKEYPILELSL